MDFGLRGRVAIVAAASKGLGCAVAEELAQEGARIAICSREAKNIEETAASIQALTKQRVFWRTVDVKQEEAIAAFVRIPKRTLGASIFA
jgi:3-oxoacyl-[acyl-carrier protein] reductase